MISHLLWRVFGLVLTLWVASLVIFSVMSVLPGDIARVLLGMNASDDAVAVLRLQLGLDDPVVVQYWRWLSGVFVGDFGVSYAYDQPVADLLGERLGVTVPLAVFGMILTIVMGVFLGVWGAVYRGRVLDKIITAVCQVGVAIPNFWLGFILIMIFALSLRWLPAGGFVPWHENPIGFIRSLILPVLTLAIPQGMILARYVRASMNDVLQSDSIRTAYSKGLTPWQVVWRHGVRQGLIPVVTIMGLQFSFMLSGVLIVENVFYLPGVGRLLFQALALRDLIVIENVVLLFVAVVIVVNGFVDMAYSIIDKRLEGAVRHDKGALS